MIGEHIMLLCIVLAAWWALFRWGSLIFSVYAIYHFCIGEWGYAFVAFAIACFIETIKRGVMFWERATGAYNGPWVCGRKR